jgi:Protein of unknown function C-terminus (DUF2399)
MADDLASAITGGIESVTGKWAKQRKAEERHASARMRRRQVMTPYRKITIKEIAWEVMEDAYLKASAGDTLPANARQIMYAARPAILERTGKSSMDDAYFTQTLLPDYITENGLEDEWDVAYDARGHLHEPHRHRLCGPKGMAAVRLGTLEVRAYTQAVPDDPLKLNHVPMDFPTVGPKNRYSSVLFLEKEGFTQLLDRARIADRYDIAIMSTKGMSVVAARALVDHLAGEGVRLFVAHDFDKSGLSIAATLTGDSRRYTYDNEVDVVDLGIRLVDVETYSLGSEPAYHRGSWWNVAANLRRNGASVEEIEFLRGRRVELNEFTSDRFIEWLEAKLEDEGVEKVIPDNDTLATAYRRVLARHAVNAKIDEITATIQEQTDRAAIPDNLAARVQSLLEDIPATAWDDAVAAIVAVDDDDEEEE